MPPTATPRSGQRTIGAPAATGTAGPRGGTGPSRQTRWIPGAGQALALNEAAARATYRAREDEPTGRKVTRADLIRRIVRDGLTRPAQDLRGQGEVPAVHDSAPSAEKSVTWVPEPDMLAALDRQGLTVGGIKRNEVLRRHVAAWLTTHEETA